MKQPLSLKARAIALLSQREHSASELRRKLLRIQAGIRAARDAREATQAAKDTEAAVREDDADDADETDDAAEVDELLGWLRVQGYLSEARFVESRVHARAQRWGQLRIRQELAQHGLALPAEAQAELKSTELARARAVYSRKFGAASASAVNAGSAGSADEERALRAKQTRFLTARGFSPEIVRAVLRGD